MNLKNIAIEQLEIKENGRMTFVSYVLCLALFVSAFTAIIETEETLHQDFGTWFVSIHIVLGILFLCEYITRVWISTKETGVKGFSERVSFIRSLPAILDLVCILPLFIGFLDGNIYLLKIMRVIAILRIVRIGRFSKACSDIFTAIASRRYELYVSSVFALILMVFSSTILYLVEGNVQPEIFGSIPRSMWWSVATLTTVGYGDAYPITVLGQLFAGITAIVGIGLIAIPTGIIAAACIEGIGSNKNRGQNNKAQDQKTCG